jgi:tRNA-modifying protein YgfZ
MKGYETLHSSSAWRDVSARGRIRMVGEDRARLLHAMTTNNVEALKPAEGCYAFFLNAQGRIQADVVILCFDDSLLLDVEPETRQKIYDHLDKFIIADDVQLEDVTETTSCIEVGGPQAEASLRALGAAIPETDFHSTEWGSRTIYKIDEERFRILTNPGDRADLTARLGEEVDEEAWNIWRLERGIPRYGQDITERHLLQETRQMQAVSFTKGCYLGQEIVERVRSRGQVHKNLAPVEIAAPEVVANEILDETGAKAGELMSRVYSPALEKTVGLAYLRTDQIGPQAKPMSIAGAAVSVR